MIADDRENLAGCALSRGFSGSLRNGNDGRAPLARDDDDLFISDFIDKAMLFVNTAGPIPFEVPSKRFGLSNSGEGCFGGLVDEATNAFEDFLFAGRPLIVLLKR